MKDTIYRKDAIKAMRDTLVAAEIPYAVNALFKIPSADRLQGKWKISKHNGDLQRYAVCDRCGYQYGAGIFNGFDCIGINYYNFCPNCGARMKGADSEKSH